MITWFAENTLTIFMAGAVALALALFFFFQSRTSQAMYSVVAVVLIAAALLLLSWLIETPREAVARSLYSLAATVEANDVQGTLNFLSPKANREIRKDIEELMPQVRIERARVIGAPEISFDTDTNPATAYVKCRGIILAVNKKDGMKGGGDDHLIMKWVRPADRWLLEECDSQKNWQCAAKTQNAVPPTPPKPIHRPLR